MSRFYIPLRLCAALLLGWLLGWLSSFPNLLDALSIDLSFETGMKVLLLLSFCLGVASAAVSMDKRGRDFNVLALSSGALVIAGSYLYFLPQALSADAACPKIDPPLFCNATTFFLTLYCVIYVFMVLLGSVLASIIIVVIRKRKDRHKEA